MDNEYRKEEDGGYACQQRTLTKDGSVEVWCPRICVDAARSGEIPCCPRYGRAAREGLC